MPDDVKKPVSEMTENEKRLAGEPFDSAKLFQEMDDSFWDATMDGLREGHEASKETPKPKD